jgi:hypothetical protein
MDWDTGFLADPKFLHLRDLLPDPIEFGYAGFCYLRLVADTWRTCERHAISSIVRGIEADALAALTTAELLDADGMVPAATFEKWVGSALQGRATQAEYARRSRGQSPAVTPSKAQSDSQSESEKGSRIGRTLGQVGTVGEVGPPDAFEAFHARTGDVPGPKLRTWLNELTARFGEANVAQRIAAVAMEDRSVPDYLRAIAAELAVQEHRAERAERADEQRRIEEKRRPVKFLPTPVEITQEEADRIAREYTAEAKAMRS